ncbi:methionyl-tRNA formyltransferase [Coprococcus catus]|uniref:methionyl-tRNA formyltransferase n=1 Tax=Coprococcus catus TaxID=116085 RepID=UPI001C0366B0|nr:methionyl-tRNA formyltransferase [Coprococcus catus]MBT9772210.1 methionyl-tRNA formyltransferase [Coprococcus catus]
MKAVFMGTPDFAVPTLQKMIDMGIEITAVVTQPDKAKGRGKKVIYSPVKECALAHDLPVYQPVRIRKEPEFIQTLRDMQPDVIVVVAFGQILPKEILDIPRLGCVNVHASLLPKFRGAAPIQWSIIDGEEVTGVTTMLMDVGLDTGDMLLKTEIPVDPKETGGSLHDKLAAVGGELLEKTLIGLEAGTIVPEKQDDSQAGEYARMLDKELGHIDFNQPAVVIERLIRGLNPWPSAYTYIDGKTLKIWEAEVLDRNYGCEYGEVAEVTRNCLIIQTGVGALSVKSVQLQGKKRMDIAAFLNGYTIEKGTRFDNE